ncbi:MAG: protein kinase [Thaumarchaeota archaeon]|nr:MAG: protein kinase [Nitrososphaerota archaeon]
MGKKKKSKKEEEEYEFFWKGIEVKPVPEDYEIIDGYPIREGYAEVVIATPPGPTPEPTYFVKEVQLEPHEIRALELLKEMLSKELEPPKPGEEEDVKKLLIETADKLLKKYKRAFGRISEDSKDRLFYYLERDMMGFGPLNVIMEDYRIEDISCDGVNVPVYVWHRDYESMPTNIMFTDRDVLDDFIIQLAHKSGKHISSAFPILDAMIYGKHRLAATFREEVSPKGSTFTIRKFREKPFSIIELLESNLMSPEMAAYFWILLEHKANIMIAGATGSGKTTLLNALACFIKPRMKIVTCEETAELNLPTENWVRFVTRESYGLGTTKMGQISLFDLVRTSLRYRPDYLIVGEVRGEEAFVLFQSIATGHGGISTIHAESVESAIKRLVSPPMNIPPSHISLLDALILIERVYLPKPFKGRAFGRRVRYIWEVADYGRYITIAEWDPLSDTFRTDFPASIILDRIALRIGKSKEDVLEELWRRKAVLEWMIRNNITELKDVANIIYSYYTDPEKFLKEHKIEVVAAAPSVGFRGEVLASWSPTSKPPSVSAEKPVEEAEIKGVEDAINYVIELLSINNGSIPYWQIFAKASIPKDLVVKALLTLRNEGKIEISEGLIKLKES